MTKGTRTRETILDQAVELASVTGLEGLTIGTLAGHTGLSKSGLFAHFGSKETLQIETLRTAARHFVELVVSPALQAKAGLDRVQALFEHWLAWSMEAGGRGGCPFVAAAAELDDRDGPARDYLVDTQRQWLNTMERSARRAVDVGDFRADLDTGQFAHDLYSIFLGFHHARRLLRDDEAETRARTAFANLVRAAQ